MAGRNSKYKPGKVYRIALNRIRVDEETDYPDGVSTEELREIVHNCGSKRRWKQDWYQDFPPIKVRYFPKNKIRQFVLVEGGDSYCKAQLLGIDTLLCAIVKDEEEAPPCGINPWFD